MLSNEKCKAILNSGDKKYSDEEITIIKEFLYQLAYLEYEQGKQYFRNEVGSDIHKGID
jgi:hypothetical protein